MAGDGEGEVAPISSPGSPGSEGSEGPAGWERAIAALALVAFWLCSVIGALLALWWARRRGSRYVERYALTSLALELVVVAGLFQYLALLPILVMASNLVNLVVLFLHLGLQLVLVVYALVLAVYAGTGRDVARAPVPRTLLDILPGASVSPGPRGRRRRCGRRRSRR